MELQVIATRNKFGVCPLCGRTLLLLKSQYTAYKLNEIAWITQELDKKVSYKGVCPKCGYTINYELNERGLEPIGFEGKPTQKPILSNKAGYIEEE